jgi:hypothetical protein
MGNGMPNYAHGKKETYAQEKRRINFEKNVDGSLCELKYGYRKPFVNYHEFD